MKSAAIVKYTDLFFLLTNLSIVSKLNVRNKFDAELDKNVNLLILYYDIGIYIYDFIKIKYIYLYEFIYLILYFCILFIYLY